MTLAAEGARGEIGGGICRGGAFFLVPHHCHNSAVVQAVHGEVPEAPLLEGQGGGRGEQSDRTEPQQEGVMWPHRYLIFLTEDTEEEKISLEMRN